MEKSSAAFVFISDLGLDLEAYDEHSGELLTSIIKAHGGLERWRWTDKIRLTFHRDGFVLDPKECPGPRQPTIAIDMHGYPASLMKNLGDGDPEDRWIFNKEGVCIESPDGVLRKERSQPRKAYEGHTLAHPWDDLHLLYSISYAMVNYLTVPFLLLEPGYEVQEIEPHEECRETWRMLQVVHPDNYPTHTKGRKFHFGANDCLLRRLEYAPDVMKEGAAAAHYCYDYKAMMV